MHDDVFVGRPGDGPVLLFDSSEWNQVDDDRMVGRIDDTVRELRDWGESSALNELVLECFKSLPILYRDAEVDVECSAPGWSSKHMA
jgi:hypothetical protein